MTFISLIKKALLFFLLLPLAAMAARVPDLYMARVPVADRSTRAMNQVLPAAYAQVLTKLTGNVGAATLPDLTLKSAQMSGLVAQYGYETQALPGGLSALMLTVTFDKKAMTDLLASASQTLWPADRPSVLVWLSDDDDGRPAIPATDDVAVSVLKQDAWARGVSLMFPMMDLDDQAAMTGSTDNLFDQKAVVTASGRYGAGAVLSGQVSHDGENWSGRWMFVQDDQAKTWTSNADSEEGLMSGAVDRITAMMQMQASNLTLPVQSVTLAIDGVDSMEQFAALQQQLKALSPVVSVSLLNITGVGMVVSVSLHGTASVLQSAIASNHRLHLVPATTDIDAAADLTYQLEALS